MLEKFLNKTKSLGEKWLSNSSNKNKTKTSETKTKEKKSKNNKKDNKQTFKESKKEKSSQESKKELSKEKVTELDERLGSNIAKINEKKAKEEANNVIKKLEKPEYNNSHNRKELFNKFLTKNKGCGGYLFTALKENKINSYISELVEKETDLYLNEEINKDNFIASISINKSYAIEYFNRLKTIVYEKETK